MEMGGPENQYVINQMVDGWSNQQAMPPLNNFIDYDY